MAPSNLPGDGVAVPAAVSTLAPIQVVAAFLRPTAADRFTPGQLDQGLFACPGLAASVLERLQQLAVSMAAPLLEAGQGSTRALLEALQVRVDAELENSFAAQIPDPQWHFDLMAAHNALLEALVDAPGPAPASTAPTLELPQVVLAEALLDAIALGQFGLEQVQAGVFSSDQGPSAVLQALELAAQSVAAELAQAGELSPGDFARGLQAWLDTEATRQMQAQTLDADALVTLLAAHNALNLLMLPLDTLLFVQQAPQPPAPGGDTHPTPDAAASITLYTADQLPLLLNRDERLAASLVARAQTLIDSFYGNLNAAQRTRLDALYQTPRVTSEGLERIIDQQRQQVNAHLATLAGREVDVDAVRIHSAREGAQPVSGPLWTWLAQGTPLQLARPRLTKDAEDFVANSWLTLDTQPLLKPDGTPVTLDEVIDMARQLDIGQAIAEHCDLWATEDDAAQRLKQHASADFQITLLNALKEGQINAEQYRHLGECVGLPEPQQAQVSPSAGFQMLRVEDHDVPVFGLRTASGNFIYAATLPEGRLFAADPDAGQSAIEVFIGLFRVDLWNTRRQQSGWSWSLLGPLARRAASAKLAQELPYRERQPATAYWASGDGVYASEAQYQRKANDVRFSAPFLIDQVAFTRMLAYARRSFIAGQFKERFTPNQDSTLEHARRISTQALELVLDTVLIAVPGKVKFPGRALLFKAMFTKQLTIDLPYSALQSKWEEVGEVLVEFFETVLEMGATRKAGALAKARLDELARHFPAPPSATGQPAVAPASQLPQRLRDMLPSTLHTLDDASLRDLAQRAGVQAPALEAMWLGQADMDMALAAAASEAFNQVLRRQASALLATPKHVELAPQIEWPVVAWLAQHLDIGITVQGEDGAPLRTFEPLSGMTLADSGVRKRDVALRRLGPWYYQPVAAGASAHDLGDVFQHVLATPSPVAADNPRRAEALRSAAAAAFSTEQGDYALYRAIHHGQRPRASVPAGEGALLPVAVAGRDRVAEGRLAGADAGAVSAEAEKCMAQANTPENLEKARYQAELSALLGGAGALGRQTLTRSAESRYLAALFEWVAHTPGLAEAVALRVSSAGRTVGVWGRENAAQVLVLERIGNDAGYRYQGRNERNEIILPAANATLPLSDLLLRLMDDSLRTRLDTNIGDAASLNKAVMARLSSPPERPTAGQPKGLDARLRLDAAIYQQTVTLTLAPSPDGLTRQDEKVWLAWGHGGLAVQPEGDAWRVLSAAGGAGPLLLRSHGEWRRLQEPLPAIERLGQAQVTEPALLARLAALNASDPTVRVLPIAQDEVSLGGSYIALRGQDTRFYRVRTAAPGTSEWEVTRADGSGGGVWVRQGVAGNWEMARTLYGGVPDDDEVVYWRPWNAPRPRPLPDGFGIQGSVYEQRFRVDGGSHKANNPFYPFVTPPAQQEVYRHRLSVGDPVLRQPSNQANIARKVEVFSREWSMPLDITSLPFFRMPGEVSTEVRFVNGALIADLLGLRVGGEPVIRRVIEPMAGSGFYANYVRAAGFAGTLRVNDMNPLVSLTQRRIAAQPDRVKHFIDAIAQNLVALARQETGLNFERMPLRADFASPEHARVFSTSETAARLRESIRQYFLKTLETHFDFSDGQIRSRATLAGEDADDYLAAAFYLMQTNSAKNAAVRINGLGRIDLPLSSVQRDHRYVHLLQSGVANLHHLNYLSYLHSGGHGPTTFSNEDGWGLLGSEEGRSNEGDLAILSGHFSSFYNTEAQFMAQVQAHVLPFVRNGGRVVIINSHSNYKEEQFAELGFRVFVLRTRTTGYLLAVNTQVAADVGLGVP